MAKRLHIRSVIICDDIRREDNGKELLIGVYSGVIIAPRLPAVLRQMACRIEYEWNGSLTHSFKLAVTTADDKTIVEATGDAALSNPADPAGLSISLGPIHFDAPAKFKIKFGIDGPARQIGWFAVRQAPQTPQAPTPAARGTDQTDTNA
jgi:Family of unknown function (DUF6941)